MYAACTATNSRLKAWLALIPGPHSTLFFFFLVDFSLLGARRALEVRHLQKFKSGAGGCGIWAIQIAGPSAPEWALIDWPTGLCSFFFLFLFRDVEIRINRIRSVRCGAWNNWDVRPTEELWMHLIGCKRQSRIGEWSLALCRLQETGYGF